MTIHDQIDPQKAGGSLFPPLGARIVKTASAVFLCLLIYVLRGYKGSAADATITAIVCMQQYVDESFQSALNRVLSTVIGAVWGLLFLLLMSINPVLSSSMIVVYALMALGVLVTLYSTVVIRRSEFAALAAIVFLCVVVAYPNVEAPVSQVINRLIDTSIGIFVAIAVNNVRLPRRKHPEKLFFMRTKDLTPTRFAQIPSRVLVAMNRFYNDGARICLISEYAPAFFISQMGAIHINTPVIMMDGAALYDVNEQTYSDIIDIPHADADKVFIALKKLKWSFNINAIRGNSMLVFHIGEPNEYESELYRVMRRSPYRNYVFGKYGQNDRITHFKITGSAEEISKLSGRLKTMIPKSLRFVVRTEESFEEAVASLYLYNVDATVDNMKQRLISILSEQGETDPVDIFSRSAAGFETERDALALFARLRSSYEPVSLLPKRKNK